MPAGLKDAGSVVIQTRKERCDSAMPIIGYFLLALARVIDAVLFAYMWILIAGAVLSWVNPDPYNPIVRFIRNVTEPLLYRIRRSLPVSFSGIDFSPLIVIFAIMFLRYWITPSMEWIANIFL
jgi:YggT family protein